MKCIIPFIVKYSPIKKLIIVPFEKNPDEIYKGFELQYIDGKEYGQGYRIIAYRNDNYVDVYDDNSLIYNSEEKFNVALNGLNKHIQTSINNVQLEANNNCELVSFSFIDIENRKIDFVIKEEAKKKTIPMNILAPIGFGTKSPNFLPLFFLYNFDFIRKNKTILECKIDNKQVEVDKFPLPMNRQFRYYARYSNQCELVEFANTEYTSLMEVELDNNSYYMDNVEYMFEKENSLSSIIIHLEDGSINCKFTPSFNINENIVGNFKVIPKSQMGFIAGNYTIEHKDNKIYIKMIPSEGWHSVPNSLITKMILKPNSIFSKWSKKYEFTEEIDVTKKLVKSNWKNNN